MGVRNIIWRPLRKGKTQPHNWQLLVELAEKYNKTPNQIVLNWMCDSGYYPMVMSTNERHIDENITSTDFKMSESDYQKMNDFRPKDYHPNEVDWEGLGIDDDLVDQVNNFEKYLK